MRSRRQSASGRCPSRHTASHRWLKLTGSLVHEPRTSVDVWPSVLTPEIDRGDEFVGTPIIDSGIEPVEAAKSGIARRRSPRARSTSCTPVCGDGTLGPMPTLVLDPQPAAIEQLLQQRAHLDLDRRDEVWEGVVHLIPPPSHEHERLAVKLVGVLDPLADAAGLELTGTVGIGKGKDDYRVPDLALHRPGYAPQWHPTAALVVEIVSPGDKTWDKLGFYAAHHVDELLIVDPAKRKVDWLALDGDTYRPTTRSALIDLTAADLAARLTWWGPARSQSS